MERSLKSKWSWQWSKTELSGEWIASSTGLFIQIDSSSKPTCPIPQDQSRLVFRNSMRALHCCLPTKLILTNTCDASPPVIAGSPFQPARRDSQSIAGVSLGTVYPKEYGPGYQWFIGVEATYSEAKTSINRILMFGFVHELMEFINTTFELSSCRSHLWPLLGTCSLHHLLPSCASWSHSLRTLVSKSVPGR